MAHTHWRYTGPITVILDNGTEVTGTGRLGHQPDDTGWQAEVAGLDAAADQIVELARLPVWIRLPGGENLRAATVLPVEVAAGPDAGLRLLLTGDDPPPT